MRRPQRFLTTCLSGALVVAWSMFWTGCDIYSDDPQYLEPAAPMMEDDGYTLPAPKSTPLPPEPATPLEPTTPMEPAAPLESESESVEPIVPPADAEDSTLE